MKSSYNFNYQLLHISYPIYIYISIPVNPINQSNFNLDSIFNTRCTNPSNTRNIQGRGRNVEISQEKRKKRERESKKQEWLRSPTRDETTLYRPSNAHPNTDPPPWMTPSLPPKISRPGASSRPFLTPPTPPARVSRPSRCFARPKFDRPVEKKGSLPSSLLSPSPSRLSVDRSTRMIDGARKTSRKGTIEAVLVAVYRLYPIPSLVDGINDRDLGDRTLRCIRRFFEKKLVASYYFWGERSGLEYVRSEIFGTLGRFSLGWRWNCSFCRREWLRATICILSFGIVACFWSKFRSLSSLEVLRLIKRVLLHGYIVR